MILAAGPQALFDEVHPALDRMAERVQFLGDRPDLAAVTKLCGNAFIIGISAVVADVLSIAHGAELSPGAALDVIGFFNPSAIISGRGKNMVMRNYAASFELSMARKDVRLMLETSGALPMAVLPGIAERMDTLIGEGQGAQDLAVLAKDAVPE